jgi:segregation and condensation protein A
VRFLELFESAATRAEVICTFLALLELIRLKQLVCVQSEAFAEIEIRRAENVAPVALAKDLDSDSTKPSIEETKT